MGLLLFAAILAVGHFEYWFKEGEPHLFIEASCVALIGLISAGLADDRRRHFDRYLIRNHIGARTYVAAKAIALVAVLLIGAAVALTLKTAYSGGSPGEALWYTTLTLSIGLLVTPLAMAIEGYVDTTMPAAFVVLGLPLLCGLVYVMTQSLAPFEWLGFTAIEPGSWRSLGPLMTRTAIGVVPAFLLAGALIQLRLRRY
jgi:hypothetical protein